MRWKNFVLVMGLIVCSNAVLGQLSMLRLQSSDSIYFEVQLDGYAKADTTSFTFDFRFDSITEIYGTLFLQLDSVITVPFEVQLDTGYISIFEITEVGNRYLALPFLKKPLGQDLAEDESPETVAYSFPLNLRAVQMPSQLGCSPPSNQFAAILRQIKKENFSSRKEKLIKKALTNNCFRINQISQLLEQIEYEDKRIMYLELAYNHSYDLNNFQQLRNLFFLDKYQAQFDAFLANKSTD